MFDFYHFMYKMKYNLGDYSRFPSPFIEGEDIGLTKINIEKLLTLDEILFF